MGIKIPVVLKGRATVVGLLFLSIPAIFVVDFYLTPWRVPTWVLYAVPIMVAARFYSAMAASSVIALAIAFSALGAWLVGLDIETEALAILGLAFVGTLSIMWADAERRSMALAQDRARLYEQEQRRAADLEESRARLLEFFSLVAHDLKGPLTTIGGYVQVLSRWDSLPAGQRERIVTGTQSAIGRIVRLSNDLSDASRIGTGRFEIHKGPCDLVALSREIVEQRQLTAPGHRLVLDARSERISGNCDMDRIAQAIGNLVDNAIKYAPEGGEVRVTVERSDNRVRVAVSDQGVGIAPEAIPRLFQPYARLGQVPEAKGLGLGLFIVKGVVEAHGGTITVQSEEGKGSTFIVDLPLTGPP